MQIDWTTRGTTVHESLQKKLQQQINKLERFLYGHCEARVIVTQEGEDAGAPRRTIEVIVRNRAGTFYGATRVA